MTQEQLQTAAEYARALEDAEWARAYGVEPVVDPNEIAARLERNPQR